MRGFFNAFIQQCIMSNLLLYFGKGNKKLNLNTNAKISTFSLPAGWCCPGANICLAKADRQTGKITKGKDCSVLCFSAKDEAFRSNVRESRWNNFELIKSHDHDPLVSLIHRSIDHYVSRDATHIRWHVSGDFFSPAYLKAVLESCSRYADDMIIYAYSKALHFFYDQNTGEPLVDLPDNFRLTASWGGLYDFMIEKFPHVFTRSARVVNSREEAQRLGLEIDEDDSLASGPKDMHFALLESKAKQKEKSAQRRLVHAI